MSQDYTTSRKQRRANRNRPVLVTSSEANGLSAADSEAIQETSSAVATETPTTTDKQPDPIAIPASPAPSRRPRRLPGFFSTIGKSDETAKEEKAEIAQARIARATRSKAASGNTSKVAAVTSEKTEKATTTSKPADKAPEKATSRPASRPMSRPNSTFKTRYIFGMVIYLIVAQFVGVFITGLFKGAKIDSVLLSFVAFGGHVVISTSTLVYLAILIILLVLLARFDLLPRSLGAISGAQPSRSNTNHSSSNGSGESRKLPTVRQGVQGADDDLYQQYRANQRKKK